VHAQRVREQKKSPDTIVEALPRKRDMKLREEGGRQNRLSFLDVDAFGSVDRYERGVGYLAAHLLCISPFGAQAQLKSNDGRTTYGDYFYQHVPPLIGRRGLVSGSP
jgi:hypothetical protein